ncbi:hypothetical protein AVEN_110940-1 [Araneus ventricosus]|uniref:Reverse transcriptase Ty1/copia-type domain-containing protein n=1 Tax=Araneus ventricosus TaxID=182803 RepID=A0A4Y2HD86_ARAVE|nr:hypothetical protein AVEN_110940-1 [Araneus ventricosus]
MFILFVSILCWNHVQLDIRAVYLSGNLSETIYMHQWPGFLIKGEENKLLIDNNVPPLVVRAWRPLRRVVHFGPLVYQSAGIPATWSVCSCGSSDSGQLLGLCVKGGRRSRKWLLAYRPWIAYKASTEAGDVQIQQLPCLVGLRGGRCRRGPNSYLVSHGFFR